MLAFEDPLIEKAYVLENSFYRRSVDLVAFLVIFSVICCRKYKFSDGLRLSFFHGKGVKVLLLHPMVDWCVDVSRGHFYAPHVPEILHATPRRHHHVGWINESIDMAYSSSE